MFISIPSDGNSVSQKEYKPVPISSFRNVTRDISFDLFLRIHDDNYAHVFSRTTGLDYKRLANYMQKGVTELFIKEEDREAYETFVAKTADSIFSDPSTSQEKKIATLLNMTEQNMAEIFTNFSIPPETADNSQKVIKNYVALMTEEPKALALILKLVSHGEYLYYHSIAVSIFSILVAKASGQFDTRMIEIIGLGGFLHDIGNSQIPKEILEKGHNLDPKQMAIKRSHPKLGLQMIENTPNIPDEVRWIVYQHHEQPGGEGYPNGLMGNAIFYPAKIVGMVDAFSALISHRPYRQAFPVEKALEMLASEPKKYDSDLVRLLATILRRQAATEKAA